MAANINRRDILAHAQSHGSQLTGEQLANRNNDILDQLDAVVAASAEQFAAGINQYTESEQLMSRTMNQIIQNPSTRHQPGIL